MSARSGLLPIRRVGSLWRTRDLGFIGLRLSIGALLIGCACFLAAGQAEPGTAGFYVVLLVTGLAMVLGSRLLARLGLKLRPPPAPAETDATPSILSLINR